MNLPLILVSADERSRGLEINQLLSEHNVTLEHPDVLILSEKLGIESIKKIREHLSWKPTLSDSRGVVINPADSLTPDAQNGLLKILEEPSAQAFLILGVQKEDSLLPTVISRCEVRVLDRLPFAKPELGYITELLDKTLHGRLEALEVIDDRKKLLQDLITFYHDEFSQNFQNVSVLKTLLEAEQWVKQNVLPKAVTDYLMLVLPKAVK